MTFLVTSSKSTVDVIFDVDSGKLMYAIVVVVILTPLAWERNIAKFSFTFLIGNFLILTTVLVTSGYAISVISEQGGKGPGIVAFNSSEYLTTLGMCIYGFEGIGVVMPIMQTCDSPEKFNKIVVMAVLTLAAAFIIFSEICYFAWGENMD